MAELNKEKVLSVSHDVVQYEYSAVLFHMDSDTTVMLWLPKFLPWNFTK